MVFLRESNTVVVYDVVSSATARIWEWNLHALNWMSKFSNTRVAIANGDAALCVEMVASPQ